MSEPQVGKVAVPGPAATRAPGVNPLGPALGHLIWAKVIGYAVSRLLDGKGF